MADYNIVKHCKMCRTRFVVNKVDAKKYYCDSCQLKIGKADTQGGKK